MKRGSFDILGGFFRAEEGSQTPSFGCPFPA
jgi:hypothetical protein